MYPENTNSTQNFFQWRQPGSALIALIILALLTPIYASNHTHRHTEHNINNLLRELTSTKRSDIGGCSQCTSDDIRREAIKLQILSKLGLKAKPRIRLPVPRDVVLETLSRAGGNLLTSKEDVQQQRISGEEEELLEAESDDFYGRTSEIITFAEPGHYLNGQPLLEFSHSSESDPGVFISQLRVKTALLWVRISLNRSILPPTRNLTLWVFKLVQPLANATYLSAKQFDQHTEMVSSLSISLSHVGWHKIDITNTVRDWYVVGSYHKEKLRLLVDCSGCKDDVSIMTFSSSRLRHGRSLDGFSDSQRIPGSTSGNEEVLDPNRPFLVVHTEPVTMKRSRRRALDCEPGMVSGHCCKESFFVSFKELKWDDWIIAPKGYHANYCRGDCGGIHRTPDTFLNYHTHVMEEFRKMDRLAGIQPCCAPLKFSSMSLIYFGPDNHIIKRDLPKMVVDQCGCP